MNKIFLDIGNSFIKWATVEDGYYELQDPVKLDDVLSHGLDTFGLEFHPNEVFYSSVADPCNVDSLKSLMQSQWQLFPVRLTSQKSCCGLTSGYEDFSSLGDDRWFAMMGAVDLFTGPVIVIDAGTALTVDAIVDGIHKGGFIVPGLYTMRKSLSLSTSDLKDVNVLSNDQTNDDIDHEDQLLATDTESAILGGTLYMAASFINQLISDLNNQLHTQFTVIVTGGEATQLTPLLDYEYELINDLVLHGMTYVEETVKKQ